MYQTLKEAIKSALQTTSAKMTKTYFKNTVTVLEDTVLTSLKEIQECAYMENIAKNPLFEYICKSLKFTGKTTQAALNELGYRLEQIVKCKKDIFNLIEEDMESNITNEGGSARSLAVFKLVNDIGSITVYSMHLLEYIVTNKEKSVIPYKRFELVEKHAPLYIELCRKYLKDLPKVIKEIKQISTEYVKFEDTPGGEKLQAMMLANTGKTVDLPVNGFVGNPIYSIRLWVIDKRISAKEYMEAKQQAIRYKLRLAKVEYNGDNDPELEKQVRQYEEQIEKLQYYIDFIDPLN